MVNGVFEVVQKCDVDLGVPLVKHLGVLGMTGVFCSCVSVCVCVCLCLSPSVFLIRLRIDFQD